MDLDKLYAELGEKLRAAKTKWDALSPEAQAYRRKLACIDWAWGQLECTTNHRMPPERFKAAMRQHLGDDYPEEWEPCSSFPSKLEDE